MLNQPSPRTSRFEGRSCQRPPLFLKVPISPDYVFDASRVSGTCPEGLLDFKGLINKILENEMTGELRPIPNCFGLAKKTRPRDAGK